MSSISYPARSRSTSLFAFFNDKREAQPVLSASTVLGLANGSLNIVRVDCDNGYSGEFTISPDGNSFNYRLLERTAEGTLSERYYFPADIVAVGATLEVLQNMPRSPNASVSLNRGEDELCGMIRVTRAHSIQPVEPTVPAQRAAAVPAALAAG